MNPGRELDAMIAEKVMGWKKDGRYFKHPTDSWKTSVLEFIPEDRGYSWGGGWTPDYLPEYSTDIAAAWEVVDKLKPKDNEFRLTKFRDNKWECTFAYFDEPPVGGNSAPHAICLAALGAVR